MLGPQLVVAIHTLYLLDALPTFSILFCVVIALELLLLHYQYHCWDIVNVIVLFTFFINVLYCINNMQTCPFVSQGCLFCQGIYYLQQCITIQTELSERSNFLLLSIWMHSCSFLDQFFHVAIGHATRRDPNDVFAKTKISLANFIPSYYLCLFIEHGITLGCSTID